VSQQIRVRRPGLLLHVGQDGQAGGVQVAAGRVALGVHGLGEFDDGGAVPGEPGRFDLDRAEGVAEEATEQGRLFCSTSRCASPIMYQLSSNRSASVLKTRPACPPVRICR
jgi:hypothetical protein